MSRTGRRACDLGVLPISLADYVKLLLWTAEQLKSGQRNTIPADLMAVLDRFHVQHEAWLDTVEKFEQMFGHAVGSRGHLDRGGRADGAQAHERDRRLPSHVHVTNTLAPRIVLPQLTRVADLRFDF